jgi:NAD(P)-dependent dehydrogenase (short-subunit alcohol dehydrogenase family)
MSAFEFSGKVAVITGAGSGFGREFALRGADLGMSLVLVDVQADALQSISDELASRGTPLMSRRVDVANGEQMDALAGEVEAEFGGVHLLFNNAGVGSAGLIWENTVADWQWVLGVNLWGVIHGMRAFVPRMLAAATADPAYRGHIVNTASMAGLLNPPTSGVYNVSKHAVVSLSETLHHDLALVGEQVRCSVLCPFYVPTGIHQSHRNRPQELANATKATASQLMAQAMTSKAVTSGKISAAEVASMTFDAIRESRFYIVSHPQALDGVRQRADDLMALRNPADPLSARPDLREAMQRALRQ